MISCNGNLSAYITGGPSLYTEKQHRPIMWHQPAAEWFRIQVYIGDITKHFLHDHVKLSLHMFVL